MRRRTAPAPLPAIVRRERFSIEMDPRSPHAVRGPGRRACWRLRLESPPYVAAFFPKAFDDRFIEQHAIPGYLPELQEHVQQAVSGAGNEDRAHLPALPHALSGGQKELQVDAQRAHESVLGVCDGGPVFWIPASAGMTRVEAARCQGFFRT